MGSPDVLCASRARHIWAKDLVCSGTIAAMDTVVRYIVPCGSQDSVRMNVVDYRLVDIQVHQGTVEDSSITVSCTRDIIFPRGECTVGTRVLFYGDRLCSDTWRLWGRYVVIRPSGRILAGVRDAKLFVDMAAPRLDQVLSSAPSGRPSSLGGLLAGSTAVGLGRVTAIDTGNKPLITVEVDSVGWAWGSAPVLPGSLRYVSREDCVVGYAVGDTILVPAQPGAGTSGAELSGCPRPLRTKHAYAPDLGVHLAYIGYALKFENGSFVQKSFLVKE